MRLNFVKISPAQNTTALVTSYCPRKLFPMVANKIISYEYLYVEQVGFILPPTKAGSTLGLEMAGGEFCGNAVLSLAAYIKHKELTDSDIFHINSPGLNEKIDCRAKAIDTNLYNVCCTMPSMKETKNIKIKVKDRQIKGQLLELDGISHFVSPMEREPLDYEGAISILKGITKTDAVGLILYKKIGTHRYKIEPFVHVKKLNTSIREKGCGSGSLALGMYLNSSRGISDVIEIVQPGGMIKVKPGSPFTISMNVMLTCEGVLFL